MKYTNPETAAELTAGQARSALLEIATILDGDPHVSADPWSTDEIEWVADVITVWAS